MKTKTALQAYGMIGKMLCAAAGGIVGFVLAGPVFVAPAMVVGFAAGYFLEKMAVTAK